MNKDVLSGNWKQVKGAVREMWGKLTDDDLTVINGRTEQLVGKLQERYGYTRQKAEQELHRFLEDREADEMDDGSEETKVGNL